MKNYKKTIDFIKRQVNLNDPMNHKQATFVMLKSLRENGEKQFVEELTESDFMIDFIQLISAENQRQILECLKIITESDVVLKDELVDEIITSICKCDFMNSEEEATIAVNVLHKIIVKVFEFDESQGRSLIKKRADELLCFITQPTFEFNSLLIATKLLNFIIKYSTRTFKQAYFSDLQNIYSMAVEFLCKNEVDSVLERLRTICCISTSIVNMCYEIDNIGPENERTLFDRIEVFAIQVVIPYLQKSEIDISSAEDFINFLESAISLRGINDNEVCRQLVKNSYLTYLLELSVFDPDRLVFRMKVCKVISKTIVTLREDFGLPTNTWPGGFVAFQNFLCNGLGSVPTDLNQFEDLLKTHDQESNSLLVLLYCHFIATQEIYKFTQKSLAMKLTSVIRKCTEPIFLKPLWLLYSVSCLTSQTSNSPSNLRLYSKAAKSLASSLQKQGSIGLYYTHHKDLLLHSIQEIEIPQGFRIKVIRLWLDGSNSDEEFTIFVKQCLDQGYDELKIVELLMILVHENCIRDLSKTVRAYAVLLEFREVIPEDVVEFILKTLAGDLANYNPSNSNILKTVLRFACTLPFSKSLPPNIVRNVALSIGKVVVREDTDSILKTLLITASVFMIRNSLGLHDSHVSEIFLNNNEFLKEVYIGGFSSQSLVLTEVSIRCLTSLIFCQIRFNIQCKSVLRVKLKDLEELLARMEEKKCSPNYGVGLMTLLLLRDRVESPLIVLQRLDSESDLDHMFNIYFLVHSIHDGAVPGEEGETYQCLSVILNYCYAQKWKIGIFLACAATPILMEIAIGRIVESKQTSSDFLNFAITWLRYRQAYRKKIQMTIKTYVEKSPALLIEFRKVVTEIANTDSNLVEDFCIVVDNYERSYEEE